MESFVPGARYQVGIKQTLSSFPFPPQEGNLKTMHITKYYCSSRRSRQFNDSVIKSNGEPAGKDKRVIIVAMSAYSVPGCLLGALYPEPPNKAAACNEGV